MNAHQVYRQTQAETASPAELVLMLYRGAVRFCVASLAAMESRDLEAAHNNLVRAQAILAELMGSLDAERGGDVARSLQVLYAYLGGRLVTANVTKTPEPVREVERLLRELLGAWEQVARGVPETERTPALAA